MSDKRSKRQGSESSRTPDKPGVVPGKQPSNAPPAPAVSASAPASSPAPGAGAGVAVPGKVQPLFRKIDWYAFAATTLITLISYWWTLAPDLTLEDSGELAVASMYAGVPHPPGYPVWTVYTWLFTVLFPVSNIAYRVAFSSAVAGAFSCGLVALMVSRGSSMMIEGIAMLKELDRKWENWLCIVSGFVAGTLIGFNGFMWSQSVIVEVYTLSVLSLAGVLVCMLRWLHAPHQRRYLYWAFFWFGISFNNHQSLLVTAIGMEVAVLAAAPRMGRDLFFWNSVVWVGGLVLKSMGLLSMLSSQDPNRINPLFLIYNLIGMSSVGIWVMLAVKTQIKQEELFRDLTMVGMLGYVLGLFGVITGFVTYFEFKKGQFVLFNMVGLGCAGGFGYFILQTTKLGREWLQALMCGGAWVIGAACYVYMPLAAMSNPPLNWGYPRTVQGFFHAFFRGQYERINPTSEVGRFIDQIFLYIGGAFEEFNLVYILIGLVPFLFFRFMQKRERAWLIGLTAVYICLSGFLLILLNPSPDRQSRDLNRVFFTASHFMIAMGVGYGLSLMGAMLSLHYERFRAIAIYVCAGAAGISLFVASIIFSSGGLELRNLVFDLVPSMDPYVRSVAVLSLLLPLAGVGIFLTARTRAPMAALLVLFACLPIRSMLAHWSDNEQRGHLFGFWFGHDMFTPPFKGPDGKPIYEEMDRDTVLFGGTDPGRFNPTYMIFCDSFIPPSKRRDPDFDRRDVYLITQNALADGTYLEYIRAHYNRSAQIDPYFFSELLRGPDEVAKNYQTNLIARLMLPVDRLFTRIGDRIEMRRRAGTSWFNESDFLDLPALVTKLKASPARDALSQFLYDGFPEATKKLIDQGGDEEDLKEALVKDLNARMDTEYRERRTLEADLEQIDKTTKDPKQKQAAIQARIDTYTGAKHQIYDLERFKHVELSSRTIRFLKQSPAGHNQIRLNRILLEEAYPGLIAKSKGGLYPDLEIHTPSQLESQKAFQDYLADAQRRLAKGELRPGEDVKIIDQKVQVSGQVAVMAINALLTKVIFDANPDHAFYVEESFPLDWMFPYLSPYGIIMKINRNPLPEITQEMADKDHDFWSQYTERLIGNWITYETSVTNICQFVKDVHIRRDYSKYRGDQKFIRDSDGQKAFSKLRSSIGGVYNYRITHAKTPQEQQRMIREAEFAFKQAYAFCPYSPEALFRFAQLLSTLGRFDEAILLAQTSRELDPNNNQIQGLIGELMRFRGQSSMLPPPMPGPSQTSADPAQIQSENTRLEQQLLLDPVNVGVVMTLVQNYQQLNDVAKAIGVLDRVLAATNADAGMVLLAAQKYNELGQLPRVEQALRKLVTLLPDNPEAWYDLAGVQATLSLHTQAVFSVSNALENSSKRRKADPSASDLYGKVMQDGRFAALQTLPQFQSILKTYNPANP